MDPAIIMKQFSFCILFLAAITGPHVLADDTETNVWGSVVNNVQISIEMQAGETQIKTNQSFNLTICIKNISSNEPFYFYQPLAIINDDPISFVVTSPSGKDVTPPPPKFEHGSGANITVPPDQICKYEFDLGSLCKFDEPGTYKIVAKMSVGAPAPKKSWAISNPLYLTVVPGQ
ncbi:MAG TPA: hypothetical protein VGI03_03735 [Verrucomicrobiae bacterium]